MNYASPLREYQSVNTEVQVSPHQAVALLLQGALDRLSSAKGCMARGETAEKGSAIGQALSIIDALRSSLDLARGGEIARNLDDLYDYMQRRLLQANLYNQAAALDEAAGLLGKIQSAWSAIAPNVA